MAELTREDVVQKAEERNIKFIRLQFTDILGVIKNVAIPVEKLEKALDGKILFDGSSIEGFVRIEESDMYLEPDPDTFTVLPWKQEEIGTARLICDIRHTDGTPFEGSPRTMLKDIIEEVESSGYSVEIGPEPEFFLFNRDEEGEATTETHDHAGYFDLSPVDMGEYARRDMVLALEKMGFFIEASHHEVAPGQHEIDFGYADPLRTADNIATFRFVVQTLAKNNHDLHATFMPKPLHGVNGSGLHLNMKLYEEEENALHDDASDNRLSNDAEHFIGGLLDHARGYTAITNPLVNSYKRLVPGYEAPIYIAWSEQNRSPLLRVPAQRGENTRIEIRNPDPSCNPYLAIGALLRAGLDGIVNDTSPPEPVDQNIKQMTGKQRAERGIDSLPSNLGRAIDELRKDETIMESLGGHIFQHFLEAKQIEWDIYRTQVYDWELEQYLDNY